MARKARKAAWEPGYNGHVYWLGKRKLGKVTRRKGGPHRYSWEAGGRGGTADDLDKARGAVEAAVAMADRQLDLFGR